MVAPNLTRDQASERSAIIGETKYAIVLDLTDGEGNPGFSFNSAGMYRGIIDANGSVVAIYGDK